MCIYVCMRVKVAPTCADPHALVRRGARAIVATSFLRLGKTRNRASALLTFTSV